MKKSILPPLLCALAAGGFLAGLLTAIPGPLSAAEKPPPARASALEQDMIGVWVHVGAPGEVRAAPATGGRLKFRTGRHWTLVGIDSRSSLVDESFGGTYTMKGDVYSETVAYGGEADAPYMGKTYDFRVKVEGDTMTQIGLNNPWHEVWKRVK